MKKSRNILNYFNKFWYIYIGIACFFVYLILFPYFRINNNELINDTTIQKEIRENNTQIIKEKIDDQFSDIKELHWTHMPITYKINFSEYNNEIFKAKEYRVMRALERIHSDIPAITFLKTESDNADIIYIGEIPTKIRLENNPDCPSEYTCNIGALAKLNFSENIIYNAIIYLPEVLRDQGGASYGWNTEIHETLHTFGIKHSNEVGGVMWPEIVGIPLNIEKNIASCLNRIYSNNPNLGNCSEVNIYKVCEKGSTLGLDGKCYPECDEGYILGNDLKCYEECGNGYCEDGTVCKEEKCYVFYHCEDGYYLDNNTNLCYPN
jgi:hypothetical protein